MSQQPGPLFTAIDHVGVGQCLDLDAAIAFYRDTYGMPAVQVHEETNEEQGVREAMMAVGDSRSCVQLLAPLTPRVTPSPPSPRPHISGPGVRRVATGWRSMAAVFRDAARAPDARAYDEPRRGTAGSRIDLPSTPRTAGHIVVEPAQGAMGH